MNTTWLRMVLVLPLLWLAGCTTSAERQESEPPLLYTEPDSRCFDINGSYSAMPHALGDTTADERPLLAQTLLPATAPLERAKTVQLQMSEAGTLHVIAYDEDGEPLLKHHYTGESDVFECDDGQLKFYRMRLDDEASAGINWDEMVLRKTQDGSLMVRKGGLLSGMIFLVFPMYVSTDDWYQFKPAH